MVTIKFCGNWSFAQRFYSLKDEKSIRAMGIFAALLYLVLPCIFLFPAIMGPVLLPHLDNPESVYIGMCLKLLPPGLMGLMVAAMFAACMSTLSAEYNITAGVITKDIYQRLIHSAAGQRELIIVARLATVFVGLFVIGGAAYVEQFGGAFEANKLITGLLGVPLVIPVVFGLVWKRPRPSGAVACVLLGVGIGVVLNLLPMIDWQTATLIQCLCCIVIFFVSGWLPAAAETKEKEYNERVRVFFAKINSPVKNEEGETAEQPKQQNGLMFLFIISLGVCGLMFLFAGLLSFTQLGGQLAVGIGSACLLYSISFLLIKVCYR
jgi:Na+/proline symporter